MNREIANNAMETLADLLDEAEQENISLKQQVQEQRKIIRALTKDVGIGLNEIKAQYAQEVADDFNHTAAMMCDAPNLESSRKNFQCFAGIMEEKARRLRDKTTCQNCLSDAEEPTQCADCETDICEHCTVDKQGKPLCSTCAVDYE